MRSLASWCVHHRRLVVAGWLLVLVLTIGLASAAKSNFSNSFSLPGTDSSRAISLLQAASPKVSGDTEQVVIGTSAGRSVTDSAVRARVEVMLASLAKVPHVTRVVSPYAAGAAVQISPGHEVAYATVTFDQPAWDISAALAKQFVHTAASAGGAGVEIAVGGQVAETSNGASLGSAGLGILAAAVVLVVVFGSVFAMLLPLISALVSLGTATALVELLSHTMSIPQFSTQLMALIGLGVGVDYALFIVTRHRQGLQAGTDVEPSIITAVNTSGRAVLFAGTIVCIAVLGMFALGVSFFYGLALATALGVALTMAASLTLLPALLGFLGPRVLSRRQRARLATEAYFSARPDVVTERPAVGPWARWAGFISRRPSLPAIVALAVVAVIAVPYFSLRLGSSDQGNDPASSTTRQAYDMLARGFGPGFNGPMQLVAVVRSPTQQAALARVVTAVRAQHGVAAVSAPELIPAKGGGEVALVTAFPATSPQAAATSVLLGQLRGHTIPAAEAGSGLHVYVGGSTAIFADFAHVISAKLALFLGIIIVLSFLVLAVVFRSLLIPLTGAVMNLLSIGAAFGVLVAVFQWGWLGSALGVTRTGPVESFLPVMLFAILFGLSMDYQVFLVTRIHEEWRRTGDNRAAVRDGLAATGRTITSAALIMILVFASFALGDLRAIKEFGIGLAGGILVDALVIRSAVVPALMLLFGRANWWFPRWLDRALPRVAVEAGSPGKAGLAPEEPRTAEVM
jgi:RND superfamily putative drug exporter